MAQKPSCSRLVEAVVTRLCYKILSPRSPEVQYHPRFDAILKKYTEIRDAILEKPMLSESGILLPIPAYHQRLMRYNNSYWPFCYHRDKILVLLVRLHLH